MITKTDLKNPHRAVKKKYLSTDLWHQNRYPTLKAGLSRNVIINLEVDQDCAQQLKRFCRVDDFDSDEELMRWLDKEMDKHFGKDKNHVGRADFFESRLYKSMAPSK